MSGSGDESFLTVVIALGAVALFLIGRNMDS
jgi:hypothetical protein